MAQQSLPSHLRGALDLSALKARHSAPGPARTGVSDGATAGGPPGAPSVVMEASDANFSTVLELSSRVPVIVEVYAGSPTASLVSLIEELAGRFVLATVDSAANPQLVSALQVTVAPTVVAIIAGRPAPLYEGELPIEQARELLDQVASLAAQNGVSGSIDVSHDKDAGESAGAEEPLPPLHQEAFDAISAGDFEKAIAAYRSALTQNPRDALALAGLAQVSLLNRVSGLDAREVRLAAASAPTDVESQLQVADLDVAGGHVADAFDRLLELFGSVDAESRDAVRLRLLELFEIVGADDNRVVEARRRLTSLMF